MSFLKTEKDLTEILQHGATKDKNPNNINTEREGIGRHEYKGRNPGSLQ